MLPDRQSALPQPSEFSSRRIALRLPAAQHRLVSRERWFGPAGDPQWLPSPRESHEYVAAEWSLEKTMKRTPRNLSETAAPR